MFASRVAKPSTKSVASSTSNPGHQHSSLVAQRSGPKSLELTRSLQPTYGDQAMIGYMTRRLSNLAANGTGSDAASAPTMAPPNVREIARQPGRPLDPATRAFFEPRF